MCHTAYKSEVAVLNEGLGKVLRFGANDASVLQRLHWLQDVAAPANEFAARKYGRGEWTEKR